MSKETTQKVRNASPSNQPIYNPLCQTEPTGFYFWRKKNKETYVEEGQ